MRWLLVVSVVALVIPPAGRADDRPIDVPIGSGKYRLIGRLHEPLGTVLTLQGVIVKGSSKLEEGKRLIRVQRINGRATQEDITIEVEEGWTDGAEPPRPEYGMSFELKGYETGAFIGIPREALEEALKKSGNKIGPAVPGFGFTHQFVYHAAKRIDPVRLGPADFVDREALLEGRAVSRDRRAYIDGAGWRLLVGADAPWPEHSEGKAVEGFGTVGKADVAGAYRLEKGRTRLVRLRDQVGRQVTLRGTAWSRNGYWWLDYRGTALYVEVVKDQPGWNVDLYGRPVEITGTLDEGRLPAVAQDTRRSDRDLKKYFIVRKPSWKPLDALLAPERGD